MSDEPPTPDGGTPVPVEHNQPTDAEVLERIEQVQDWISEGNFRQSTIKRLFREKYGETPKSTVIDYIGRARVRTLEHIGRGRAQMRGDIALVLERIMRDSDLRNVIAAVRLYMECFGLALEVPLLELICGRYNITPQQFASFVRGVRGGLPRPDNVDAGPGPAPVPGIPGEAG